jgi:hypothetical protein
MPIRRLDRRRARSDDIRQDVAFCAASWARFSFKSPWMKAAFFFVAAIAGFLSAAGERLMCLRRNRTRRGAGTPEKLFGRPASFDGRRPGDQVRAIRS